MLRSIPCLPFASALSLSLLAAQATPPVVPPAELPAIYLKARRFFDGKHEPLQNVVIVVRDRKVAEVRTKGDVPAGAG